MQIYHSVLYQAFDDNLRIVYSKIMRKLNVLQLRDRDGRRLLVQRDNELIQCTIGKMTVKVLLAKRLEQNTEKNMIA